VHVEVSLLGDNRSAAALDAADTLLCTGRAVLESPPPPALAPTCLLSAVSSAQPAVLWLSTAGAAGAPGGWLGAIESGRAAAVVPRDGVELGDVRGTVAFSVGLAATQLCTAARVSTAQQLARRGVREAVEKEPLDTAGTERVVVSLRQRVCPSSNLTLFTILTNRASRLCMRSTSRGACAARLTAY
jgi:hypothetical protein